MRIVKSFDDIQKVLNELLDWKSAISTKDIDLTGRRIRNANTSLDKSDYVTRQELPPPFPTIPVIPDQPFTVVFDKETDVVTSEQIPSFVFGIGRESSPVEVWLNVENAPVTDLKINIQLYQRNPLGADIAPFSILAADLTMPAGTKAIVSSRTLISPLPKFGRYSKIQPIIIAGGGAVCVSIGIICKRII